MGTGRLGKGKGTGPAHPVSSQAPPLAGLSVSLSPKDRGTSPVQDPMVLGLQPLRRAGHGSGVKGLGLGFKCPPSQVLSSVGPVGQKRGQDQGREDGLG